MLMYYDYELILIIQDLSTAVDTIDHDSFGQPWYHIKNRCFYVFISRYTGYL